MIIFQKNSKHVLKQKKELDRIISLRKEAPEVVDKVDVESIQKSIEDARDENQENF